MLICILAGVLLGIAERFILSVTARKARQAESHGVLRILYQGTAIRVVIVVGGLVLGAIMMNETMFICLAVSYAMIRLAMLFADLWSSLVRGSKPCKRRESQ